MCFRTMALVKACENLDLEQLQVFALNISNKRDHPNTPETMVVTAVLVQINHS